MTTQHELPPCDVMGRDSGHWDEQLARTLAEADGIGPLGDQHWRVIHYLREHFVLYGAAPPMHLACVNTHMEPHCIERLFQGAREAWRISGLPDPGAEQCSYMD